MLGTLHDHTVVVVVDRLLEVKSSSYFESQIELAFRSHPRSIVHGAQPMMARAGAPPLASGIEGSTAVLISITGLIRTP